MPFSPAILKQINDAIDPNCLLIPEPPAPVNAATDLSNFAFRDENGKLVNGGKGLPAMDRCYTVSFGFNGCKAICDKSNANLASLDKSGGPWKHVFINVAPEEEAPGGKEYKQEGMTFKQFIASAGIDPKDIIVLYPVDPTTQKYANSEAIRVEQKGFKVRCDNKNNYEHSPTVIFFKQDGTESDRMTFTAIPSNHKKLNAACNSR